MGRSALFLLVLAVAGCDGGGDADDAAALPECVDLSFDVASCSPLFPPTYDRIYEEVFVGVDGQSGCAAGGSACHADSTAAGAGAGMVFDADADATYASVSTFIEAGDPSCGPFSVRLHIDDPELRMPPGALAMAEGARCAIAQWIEAGATR
jgi:hypothetical protein